MNGRFNVSFAIDFTGSNYNDGVDRHCYNKDISQKVDKNEMLWIQRRTSRQCRLLTPRITASQPFPSPFFLLARQTG